MGVAISVAALWVALRQTSLGPLSDAVRGADFRYVALAAIVYLISMGARALCWKSILGGRAPVLKLIGALIEIRRKHVLPQMEFDIIKSIGFLYMESQVITMMRIPL